MADQLQKDIRGMRYDENRPHQSGSDQLLLTAKVRVCAESLADGVGDRMLVGCSRGDS